MMPLAKPPRTRYQRELLEARRVIFQRALDETGGNVAQAARRLGVQRYVLYRWRPVLAR